jgi:hypothetical protein
MQFAKDSFFLALRERLAGLNPARVVTVDGATVPAVLVAENLPPTYGQPQANTFYVYWGSAELESGPGWSCGLMSIDVAISYYSLGSVQSMVDRGRLLAQLDAELLCICQPFNTEKRDYTRSPSADLGTRVFWTRPSFAATGGDATERASSGKGRIKMGVKLFEEARVERKAQLKLYFFPEVTLS